MQKFTLTGAAGNGDYKIDVPLGRTFTLALSGTRSTAVMTAQYATAPGTFVGYATPITLSAVGNVSGVNIGAHTEINVNIASAGAGDSLILIANVIPS